MEKAKVMQRIRDVGLLPVVRGSSPEVALQMAEAIAEGGIPAIELTMTVPGAVRLIGQLIKQRPDLLIGAGTVLDAATARMCILEGAQFVVSPALDVATIEMCHRYSTVVLPGALTPTEIVTAWSAGADIVKVFPSAAMGGPKYLRHIKAPLPQIELIPTGGVSLDNAAEFLAAGAYAIGIGSDLANEVALREGRRQSIVDTAQKYAAIFHHHRVTSHRA